MIYRVELKAVRKLVPFPVKDCCNGQPAGTVHPYARELLKLLQPPGLPCLPNRFLARSLQHDKTPRSSGSSACRMGAAWA
jgi:hypothetical protein